MGYLLEAKIIIMERFVIRFEIVPGDDDPAATI